MKKLIGVITLSGMLFLFSRCATLMVEAPPDQDVQLTAAPAPPTVKVTKRVWYAIWGLVPITDNSTMEVAKQYNLKEIRVTTYHGVVDILIDIFLGWATITARTVKIEGTPKK